MIAATCGDFKGDLGVTVTTACPEKRHFSAAAINRKIEFSPEMAARLGAPLESLRLAAGVVTDAGTAGMSFPSCAYCPQASYTNEAVIAKYHGTAVLTAVITAEGRASVIQVTPGIEVWARAERGGCDRELAIHSGARSRREPGKREANN